MPRSQSIFVAFLVVLILGVGWIGSISSCPKYHIEGISEGFWTGARLSQTSSGEKTSSVVFIHTTEGEIFWIDAFSTEIRKSQTDVDAHVLVLGDMKIRVTYNDEVHDKPLQLSLTVHAVANTERLSVTTPDSYLKPLQKRFVLPCIA